MQWLYWENIWCWLAVALAIFLASRVLRRTVRAQRLFFDGHATMRLWLKLAMKATALSLIGIALLGPAWGERAFDAPPAHGRDVLVLLDVSRSMLAEDAAPNRLAVAKGCIRRLATDLEAMAGHRIGLITFADRAAVLSPLTSDFQHFHQELEQASLEGLRLKRETAIVSDGTQLGLALSRARRLLATEQQQQTEATCDLVVVSDGGDETAAQLASQLDQLAALKVRIFTLGVGDPNKESPIPIIGVRGQRELLTYEGQQVATRLEDAPLRLMAEKTGGQYVQNNGGDGAVTAILKRIQSATQRELTHAAVAKEPILRFEWFLLPAVLLLIIEQMISSSCSVKLGKMGSERVAWLRKVVRPDTTSAGSLVHSAPETLAKA